MVWLRFPRVLGLVIALYFGALSVLFVDLSVRNAAFDAHAATTTATVVALVPRAAAGSAREPSPTLRSMPLAPQVSYTVGGHAYTYTAAHGRYRQRLRVGDDVQVLYLPGDPSQARLTGEGRVLMPLLATAFGLAAAGVLVLLVATRRLGRAGRQPERPPRVALPPETDGVEPDDGPGRLVGVARRHGGASG